jgi:cation-transporting ATPase E
MNTGVNIKGLSSAEAESRRLMGLANAADERITKTAGQIIFGHTVTFFNALNVALGIALALIGTWENMGYLLIILINTAAGIVQELKAKHQIEKLTLMSAPTVNVMRDGQLSELHCSEVVLDDIIVLDAGKQVPADCLSVTGNVEVSEALVTGESEPVPKQSGDSLLSGSFIISGKCYAKAVKVGNSSFAARLTHDARFYKKVSSELLKGIEFVSKIMGACIIPAGAVMVVQALFLRGESLYDCIVSTCGAMLSMIPMGLVLITTIALAAAVVKLAGKKVLIRSMNSIETVARADIVCLDKTGTLTCGEMKVTDFLPFSHDAEEKITAFVSACEDNNATFYAVKEYFKTQTNPQKTTGKVMFSSQRKYSAVSFEFGTVFFGAPEALPGTDCRQVRDLVSEGKRVLCFAFSADKPALPEKAELLAVIGIDDPVREDAKEMLAFLKETGAGIKIISGDNPVSVSHIARRLDFENYDAYLDCSKSFPAAEQLPDSVLKYDIFGRVSPYQKQAIVKALRTSHTVAMTGDGVNDVLALRESDCGIAVSSACDAAKQAADIVVTGGLSSLMPTVAEGRHIIENTTRTSSVFFMKTLFSGMLTLIAILTNTPFPFIPLQMTVFGAFLEAYPCFVLTFPLFKGKASKFEPVKPFLKTSLANAFPFSAAIALVFLILSFVPGEQFGIIYSSLGVIGTLALLRIFSPLNIYRVIICITSAAGFFLSAYFFKDFLF